MKKSLFIAVIVLFVAVFVTGCGASKKLVCKQKASGVDITFNVGFEGNKVKDMDFSYDMDLSSYSASSIAMIEKQNFCSLVKSSMDDYKDAFTDCKQKVADKHLKVDAVLDVKKISKNASKSMTSPNKAKKELEKTGYTCEIK
ncbi:MAG: hypothetical protein IJF92_05080 [Bacilli bacterium]|nr:hypothetical protein [Bacilli bacterium]